MVMKRLYDIQMGAYVLLIDPSADSGDNHSTPHL